MSIPCNFISYPIIYTYPLIIYFVGIYLKFIRGSVFIAL